MVSPTLWLVVRHCEALSMIPCWLAIVLAFVAGVAAGGVVMLAAVRAAIQSAFSHF